jgi:hypothetical protein
MIINETNLTIRNDLLINEQYYINLLKPEYNILTKAYNSTGFKFKHSPEAILKIKQYRNNSQNLSKKVYVYNINNNLINNFISLSEASKFLKISISTITKYEKLGKI